MKNPNASIAKRYWTLIEKGHEVEVRWKSKEEETWSPWALPPVDCSPDFAPYRKYEIRIKKRIYIVNGREVPAPLIDPPAEGTAVYYPDFDEFYQSFYIRGLFSIKNEYWRLRLKNGLLYLSPEDAIKRAKAMLILTPKD